MFGSPYANHTIRKLTVAFGSLFNDISLQRFDAEGDVQQTIKVPLSYGPSDAILTREQQKTSIDEKSEVQMSLPRMSFELTSVQYDNSRKLDSLRKHIRRSGETIKAVFQRVPFRSTYNLYVAAKGIEDVLTIVEQILPNFRPEIFLKIKDAEDYGFGTTIPIVLESVGMDDNYEEGLRELRTVMWTLSFRVDYYLYGRLSDDAKLIYEVDANLYNDPNMTKLIETITWTATPGSPNPVPYTIEKELIDGPFDPVVEQVPTDPDEQ